MSNPIQSRPVLALGAAALALCGVSDGAIADKEDAVDVKAHEDEAEEEYPAQLSLRPLTLPQGMAQASMGGGYVWIDGEPNVAPMSIAASFGLTDWWDASAHTFFRLKPGAEWRDVVGLSTKMLAYDSERVDFAPGIYVPINFDNADGAHLFPAVVLDATTRIHITKQYSVILGHGLVPLSIGRRASLNLNYSVILQARPSFGYQISSQLFHLRLNGDVRKSSFARALPALTMFRSIGNWIDFSVTYAHFGNAQGLFGGIDIRH